MAKTTKNETVSPEVESLLSPEAEDTVKKEMEEAGSTQEACDNPSTADAVTLPLGKGGGDDGKVDYVVPMNVFGDGDYVTVGLNGVNYQIEVGVQVRVPKGVKVILDEAIKRKKIASGKAKEMSNKN